MIAQLDLFVEAIPDNRRTATTAALHRITPAARAHIEAAIRASVSDAGYVSANDFRDRIDRDINPKWVGVVVRSLRARGVLVPVDSVRSDDTRGGNAGRWIDVYRWVGAAC